MCVAGSRLDTAHFQRNFLPFYYFCLLQLVVFVMEGTEGGSRAEKPPPLRPPQPARGDPPLREPVPRAAMGSGSVSLPRVIDAAVSKYNLLAGSRPQIPGGAPQPLLWPSGTALRHR